MTRHAALSSTGKIVLKHRDDIDLLTAHSATLDTASAAVKPN
jgi:hypothetical protein